MMRRTIHRDLKVLAIATADWHLREDSPVCRLDNFWNAQWEKIAFIKSLQQKYDCPVLHAGDLFHHWKPSPHLLSVTMDFLPDQFYTVYGNHDLPQHNMSLRDKSGIYTLETAGKLHTLAEASWNELPQEGSLSLGELNVLVWHVMTWTHKVPFPGCQTASAEKLLERYIFDLIITGDNHQTFVVERDGRMLINPGSLTRQTADQADFQPCVFLILEGGKVKELPLPIHKDVITREHLERKEQRDQRIEAFVSRLNEEWESGVSFEENLRRFEQSNQVRQSVMDIVWKSIET